MLVFRPISNENTEIHDGSKYQPARDEAESDESRRNRGARFVIQIPPNVRKRNLLLRAFGYVDGSLMAVGNLEFACKASLGPGLRLEIAFFQEGVCLSALTKRTRERGEITLGIR